MVGIWIAVADKCTEAGEEVTISYLSDEELLRLMNPLLPDLVGYVC